MAAEARTMKAKLSWAGCLAAVCFVVGVSFGGLRADEAAPAAAESMLSAAEVRGSVVGHSVALADGGMTWYFSADGTYDADDGRVSRSGKFSVQPDGRLCWTESTGIDGCFQYYRTGGKLMVRRADPGHDTELGAVTLGNL